MNTPDVAPDLVSSGGGEGAAPNPMLSVLIDALSGSGRVDPLALLQTQLGAQAQTNPQVAQILLLLKQQREQQTRAVDEDSSELSEEEAQGSAESSEALDDTVQRVYSELEALRARNRAFAAAVGACALCFGDDPLCEECGGLGAPGSLTPKPGAFRKYVLPAFRRARAIEMGRDERARRSVGEPASRSRRDAAAYGASQPQ